MSGADGAGESIDRFGKFLLKFSEAFGAHVPGVGVRDKKSEQAAGPGEQEIAAGDRGDNGEHHRRDGAKHEEVSGADIDIALGENLLQGGDTFGAA